MQQFQDGRLAAQRAGDQPSGNNGRRRQFFGCLLLLLILIAAGCETANVNSPLTAHPEKLRRLAILPICFGRPSSTGYLTVTGDPETVRQQAGAEFVSELTNQIGRKGYQLVNPVSVLSSEKDWCGIDMTAAGILRQQFDLERMRSNPGETNELYAYGFVSSLSVLQERLGLPEADAIILIERWEAYVAPDKANKSMPLAAKIVIYPIGIAAVTFMVVALASQGDIPDLVTMFDPGRRESASNDSSMQPDISICYSIYIFDPSTRQIIYSAYHPKSSMSSSRAVRALLGPLPRIRE